jgi:hypothetical protein
MMPNKSFESYLMRSFKRLSNILGVIRFRKIVWKARKHVEDVKYVQSLCQHPKRKDILGDIGVDESIILKDI